MSLSRIYSFTLYLISFPIFFLLLSTSSIHAQSNTFSCSFNPGTMECYVDASSTHCAGLYTTDPGFCSQYNNQENSCISATGTCVLTESSSYQCSDGMCTPCDEEEDRIGLCSYHSLEECQDACTSASSRYRCINNGCVSSPNCDLNDPSCFSSQQACEASNCKPVSPTPLPDCSSITDADACNRAPNCTWRNNQCVVGAESNVTPTPDDDAPPPELKVCNTLPGTSKDECLKCMGDSANPGKVYTALGCVSATSLGFVGDILTIAIGMGGGLALLLMAFGAFQVSTSAGNPEQSQKGREMFTSAIMGLLFIIFSAVLLKIIGFDILHLPGF